MRSPFSSLLFVLFATVGMEEFVNTFLTMDRYIRDAERVQPSVNQQSDEAVAYDCACAVLGGRFNNIKTAVAHQDFARAPIELVKEIFERIKDNEDAINFANIKEDERLQAELQSILSCEDSTPSRSDLPWLEERFKRLMLEADGDALHMNEFDIAKWKWTFELAELDDRRYYAYAFQYAVYKDLTRRNTGAYVVGGQKLVEVASSIFGNDGAYSMRQVKDAVAAGICSRPEPGRRPSFPRDVEGVLFKFIAKLRSVKCPVYRSTVIHYAKVLLEGTEASLNFAKIKEGVFVPSPHGGVEWDNVKLNNWFYRRFIGDRREVRRQLFGTSFLHSYPHPLPSP